MKKKRLVFLTVFLMVLSLAAFAEERDIQTISVGIHPFGPLWGVYKVDIGVPINGILEVAGQINYWSVEQLVKLYGVDPTELGDMPNFLTAGVLLRVFPSQEASGFFIGGRAMYLMVKLPEAAGGDSYSDMTAGVDLGWRFKWNFDAGWGMFFQTYVGIQRWIFRGGDFAETIGLAFPLWPTGGMHFGVHF
jgi:hypothetical protein